LKLCRFDDRRAGVVLDGRVHDITALVSPLLGREDGAGDTVVRALPAIRALPESALRSAPSRRLKDVRLLSPVLAPTKIVAAPVNYRAHVEEANNDPGIRYGHTITDIQEAGVFLKATSSLAGPSAGIPVRFPERRTDYEIELVVVIGREGTDIPAADALGHVAGYSVGLDITLRGPEDRSCRKSLDGYSVVGSFLVTADEIADPNALDISLSLNGEERQRGNTRDMVYGVQRLIEFASSFYTLYPGDLIFTGTPEGVGPIRPGDRILGKVEGVGTLEATVRAHMPRRAGEIGGPKAA